ncbi:MAG: isocitrate/isopropylmalate family dehydrogenase [Candidatus Parvarchaeota archaeon]
MSTYKIAVARGDGIGPEVVDASISVLNYIQDNLPFNVKFDFKDVPVGWEGIKTFGSSLPEESIKAIRSTQALILGPLDVGTYPISDPGGPSPSGKIRKLFDLYTNIRPTVSYGLNPCYPPQSANFVIVRENTEGFYADRNMFLGNGEFMPNEDTAISLRVITRTKSAKVINEAFRIAKKRRNKVTAVHKANILKMTDGLFLDVFREYSAKNPEVVTNDMIVDAMSLDMIKNPSKYDVIVTTNMYGDILSDEAAIISGSLGLAPSLNYGENFAMAQAVHGSAPDIAKKGIANPIAEILSCGMLLAWMSDKYNDPNLLTIYKAISFSVESTIQKKDGLTPDMGGTGTTSTTVARIIENLGRSF